MSVFKINNPGCPCDCGGTGLITVSGCPCAIPNGMTVTNTMGANFYAPYYPQTGDTITLQSSPSHYASWDFGGASGVGVAGSLKHWWTDREYTDPNNFSLLYRYVFFCQNSFFLISQTYRDEINAGAGYVYRWLPGSNGNTCSPWLLKYGRGNTNVVPFSYQLVLTA